MKKVLFLLFVFSVCLYAEDKPDFSGTWKLNLEISQLPQMGNRAMPERTLVISQKNNDIEIEPIYKTQRGERKSKLNLVIGGKETQIESPMMGRRPGRGGQKPITIGKAKWSTDGKSLEITSKMTMVSQRGSFTMRSFSSYSLSKDGKILSEKQTMTTPRGERESEMVYEKVEKK